MNEIDKIEDAKCFLSIECGCAELDLLDGDCNNVEQAKGFVRACHVAVDLMNEKLEQLKSVK